MRIRDLVPGQRWIGGDTSAIFVTQVPHGTYPGLNLVVWWIEQDMIDPGRWSLDALLPDMDVTKQGIHLHRSCNPELVSPGSALRACNTNLRAVLK